ncbi:MarR family winged helix-turn-helix transcriptional regulator [Rhodoferax sp.]|uniref:MarR family winged helix-turn-helix transcriptional regulator n=1 Tax=Rhodoferax sp. TaxID=50421 RepID=UPI00374D6D0C
MTAKPVSAPEPTPSASTQAQGPTFYRPDSYATEGGSVGLLMHRVVNSVTQELERQFEPTGLTNAQWKPLFKLSTTNITTVAELARECTLDAGGMTRMLDRLEAKGLLRRERSSEDRRVVNLALTDSGREVAKVIPEILSRVQNAYLEGFSVEEWQTLKSYLRRMLDNGSDIHAKHTSGEKNA